MPANADRLHRRTFARVLLLTAASAFVACAGQEAPDGLWESRRAGGPVVAFDLFALPLPQVPLPNDIATRPDRSSPTGRRINASMLAATEYEHDVRRELDRLDGWGTFAPMTVTFEPVEQRLDLANVLRRHRDDGFDFSDDAVYLIDIDPSSESFGRPVPLDIGEGSFPWNLRRYDDYYDNDPRAQTSTLLFDTYFEDLNGNGVLDLCGDRNRNGVADEGDIVDAEGEVVSAERDVNGNGLLDPEEDLNGNGRLDCSEDTDFDGHLDVPNLFCGDDETGQPIPPESCPDVVVPTASGDVVIPAEDAWITLWYERETNTMMMQPLVPLRERTTYAVVLTRRLVDEEGRPVESPFPSAHHVDQGEPLRPLEGILADNSDLYGGLTLEGVQFAWTFTTQSIAGDFQAIREGLYGRGPLEELAEEFPPEMLVDLLQGCLPGLECDLPSNPYILRATETDGERGLLDIVSDVLEEIDIDLGADQETIDIVMAPYDAVSHFAHVRFSSPNFLDSDGVSEDLDGDGLLDLSDEDLDGNGQLDPGEDLDFDGHLDVNEDLNDNLILDGEEGVFDLDVASGHAPHSQHFVTALISVPKADPERGIEPPYPVVVYNHGYGLFRIESLILAAYMARNGLATIGVDAAHHGLGIEPVLIEVVESIINRENLVPFGEALQRDRALDLNGDGMRESGADFVTADAVHMRDMVRQTSIDLARLVQIVRSFDGERRGDQDLDGDGRAELAGDFDADGVVDLGGPDADFFVTGNSLGGINSTVFAGLEPSIVAAAPISGGGGLSHVGLRSTLGNVQAAAVLPMLGPLMTTNPAQRYFSFLRCSNDDECPGDGGCREGHCRCSVDYDCRGRSGYRCFEPPTKLASGGSLCANRGDTGCDLDQVSARLVVNDLNNDVQVEFACIDEDDLREGDTLVAENLVNGERDCFVAWPDGRSRLHLASDAFDPLRLSIYDGEVLVEGPRCTLWESAEVRRVIDTFELEASFQQVEWSVDDPLQMPSPGFGLRRATPSARRFVAIAQILLEPADPANLARRHFLDPIDYGDATRRAATLSVSTVGDDAVAISSGIAIARAAGIVDFERPDPRLGELTHNRYLIDRGVMNGLSRLSPYRRESDGRQVNFDPDDYDRSASPPEPDWIGDGLDAPSDAVPLRAWRPIIDGDECTCLDSLGEHSCSWPGDTEGPLEMVRCPGGVAALSLPYFKVDGSHALIPEPGPHFDVYTFMANMIGRYFATRGQELRFDICMNDNTCTEEEHGFSTPPFDE